MWLHSRTLIFMYMFLYTYTLSTQNLMLQIEYNERSDKQTTLNEINILFINTTGITENTVQHHLDITSRFHGNYANSINKNKEQTVLTTPTYDFNQLESKNKQFQAKTIKFTNKYDVKNRYNEDDIKTVEYTNKQNVANINHKDGIKRDEYTNKQKVANINQEEGIKRDEYTNQLVVPNINQEVIIKKIKYLNPHNEVKTNYEDTLRILEDYSVKKINAQPIFRNMDAANRIKDNLELFTMIRKEKHIATPKFDFPVTNFDKTYYDENNYMERITNINRLSAPSFDESNIFNKRLREVPNIIRHPIHNYSETNLHNQRNNFLSKMHGLNDENYKHIQKLNVIHHPINPNEGVYKKIHMGKNQDLNYENYRRNRNYNDHSYGYFQRSYNDFSTPKINKINLYNKHNYRLRNRHYANDYDYRINQNYNEIDYHNVETNNKKFTESTYDETNLYNKENNHMNKNNFNDNNYKINQNYKNTDNHNDQSREKFEKNVILDVLNKQNKLIEKIAERLLKNKIKREGDEKIKSWTEFDDIVKSLEMRDKTKSTGTSKSSTTTTTLTLPTIISLIDETEIRKALQKDPFVKRILKMANKKKLEYENHLK